MYLLAVASCWLKLLERRGIKFKENRCYDLDSDISATM